MLLTLSERLMRPWRGCDLAGEGDAGLGVGPVLYRKDAFCSDGGIAYRKSLKSCTGSCGRCVPVWQDHLAVHFENRVVWNRLWMSRPIGLRNQFEGLWCSLVWMSSLQYAAYVPS